MEPTASLAHAKAAKGRGAEAVKAESARQELRFRAAWLQDLRAKDLQPQTGPSAAGGLQRSGPDWPNGKRSGGQPDSSYSALHCEFI